MVTGEPNPIAENLLARLPTSPDAYPQKIDLVREAALLIELDPASYRGASFLDDRILSPATRGAWLPLTRLAGAAPPATTARPLHYIFHTGHVGSTLVSRLVEAAGNVLALREPLPLRTLAEGHDVVERPDSLLSRAEFDRLIALFTALWRRGYTPTQTVVLKATSSSARVALPLLAAAPEARAIYLNLAAEPYLATLLAGTNSSADLRGHGPERLRRLQRWTTTTLTPLHALSLGELAAQGWLAETATQARTVAASDGRVVALDFDRFLSDVRGGMHAILRHFGLPLDERYLADVHRNPVLTRYSKAPEYAYSPDVRADILRDSRRDNREEIGKGMRWLERLAHVDPLAAQLLKSSAG